MESTDSPFYLRDFYALSQLGLSSAKCIEEKYQIVRSFFAVGDIKNYHRANNSFKSDKHLTHLSLLAESFEAVEKNQNAEELIARLTIHKEEFLNNDFFMGEFFLALGLLYGQLKKNYLSLQFFLKSEEYFLKTLYVVPLWYAQFNIFLVYRRMGDLQKAKTYQEKILQIEAIAPSPSKARIYWLLSGVYYTDLCIDRAIISLEEAAGIHRNYNNHIGMVECQMDLLFFNFKKGVEFKRPTLKVPFGNRYFDTYKEMVALLSTPTKRLTESTVEGWISANMDPLFVHRLVDIFLSRIERELPPDERLNIINKIDNQLITRKMYIPFYSLDYFRAVAHYQSNNHAMIVLGREVSQRNENFENPLISKQFNDLFSKMTIRSRKKKDSVKIRLDTTCHILIVDSRAINLAQMPSMERALVFLYGQTEGVSPFMLLKACSPKMSEDNLTSVRVKNFLRLLRNLIPDAELLEEKNGVVKLNPRLKFELVDTLAPGGEDRQMNILNLLKRSKFPLTAGQISRNFSFGLRTLQEELRLLQQGGKVFRVRRGRTYVYLARTTGKTF